MRFILMCIEGVPGQRAASAQPLILYVATQDILGSLEEHGKRHTRDVALLRGGHLVAERKLQKRLETHLRKLLPHPHINLCLWKEKAIYLIGLFCWWHSLEWFTVNLQRGFYCLAQHMKSLTGAIVGHREGFYNEPIVTMWSQHLPSQKFSKYKRTA